MKKNLTLVFVLALLLSLGGCGLAAPAATASPAAASASAPAVSDAAETAAPATETAAPSDAAGLSGACGEGLTWSYAGGALTIRGQGPMDDYELLAAPWDLAGASFSVETLTVEEGVTYLGGTAFASCCNLRSVSLPSTLAGIGKSAFADCVALTALEFPQGLVYIGDSAFSGAGLTSLTLPAGTAALGDLAFTLCGSLADASLPDSLFSFGDDVFSGCGALKTIRVNNGSAAETWLNANGYADLVSPSGQDADAQALAWSGSTGGLSWRLGTDGALAVDGSGAMPDYASEGGRAAPWAVLTTRVTGIAVGSGVTSVGSYAFWNCTAAQSASLAESVTTIGDYAFGACEALTDVALPAGVTALGVGSFSCCLGLRSLSLPDGLQSIGEDAFQLCAALESLTIPAGVSSIGAGAFDFGTAEGETGPVLHVQSGSYAEQWLRDNGCGALIG